MSDIKRVYAFGGDGTEGGKEMKFQLGGKGANLAEMARLGLPVPPGFTITCQACMEYYNSAPPGFPEGLSEEIAANVALLEEKMGKRLGDDQRPAAGLGPLGFAVLDAGHDGHRPEPRPERRLHPGADRADRHRQTLKASVSPGTPTADSSRCSPRWSWTSRADFWHAGEKFENAITLMRQKRDVKVDTDLTAEDLKQLVAEFKADRVGQRPPPMSSRRSWGPTARSCSRRTSTRSSGSRSRRSSVAG